MGTSGSRPPLPLAFVYSILIGMSATSFNLVSGFLVRRGRMGVSFRLMRSSLTTSGVQFDVSDAVWDVYDEMLESVLQNDRIMGPKLRKQNQNDPSHVTRVQELLRYRTSTTTTTTEQQRLPELNPKQWLMDQKQSFLDAVDLSVLQYEYYSRCLCYMADLSAKRSEPTVAMIAWHRIKDAGLLPRENTLSTLMYVLAIDVEHEYANEACFEVAALHDAIYKPNEKTILFRIKSLIAKGNPLGAEQVLHQLRDKAEGDSGTAQWKRLRTYQPILDEYCRTDFDSAHRLYREMRQSDGVFMEADTYARVVESAAMQGKLGPQLFDELVTDMAEDVLELDETSLATLQHAFEQLPNEHAICEQVSLTESGTCPRTNVQLRLFALSERQRLDVHDTLLIMADEAHREFFLEKQKHKNSNNVKGGKSRERKDDPTMNPSYASTELARFSKWLRLGDTSFTAFVDGANVAFFGHGYFDWRQLNRVVDELEALGETPLVIIPQKYTAAKFWLNSARSFQHLEEEELLVLNELLESKKLYVVQPRCLDDYYWMLASVARPASRQDESENQRPSQLPGIRPILISNDRMRDHRLSLLEARLFRRWTSCHIVNYEISSDQQEGSEDERSVIDFFPADSFSREIQGNRDRDNKIVWHFPVESGSKYDRLCVSLRS